MKNSLHLVIISFVIAVATINDVSSQVYYKPNEKAQKIYDEIHYDMVTQTLQRKSQKEIEQFEKKLNKCIALDSNFALPYAGLGNISMINQKFLSKTGAFYYYSKYLEKSKKYPFKENDFWSGNIINILNQESINSNDGGNCIIAIKANRLLSLFMGYKMNPEYFNEKKGVNNFVSIDELSNYIQLCEGDLENLSEYRFNIYSDNSQLYQYYFDLYTIKGELEFNRGNYSESALSYKLLIGKLKIGTTDNNERKTIILLKRQVYEKLYNMFISIDDNESALNSLIEFFKIPFLDSDFNSISFQKKRKEVFRLIGIIHGFNQNSYEICQADGKQVFCQNKNIELDNYSSAIQFLNAYNQNNLLEIIFGKGEITTGDYPNHISSYATVKYIYSFYLQKGKEEGMIWPNYSPMDINKDYQSWTIINDLANCDCIPNVIDIKLTGPNEIQIFRQSAKDSSLTVVQKYVNYDWQMLNNIPTTYYNSQKNIVTQTSKGEQLPTFATCVKLYLLEKQNYENKQALLRAEQLQQEAEVRRLQQEQNYKETQLRLIEEQNIRKQKEIDLINANNQQIDKKKELESQKAATAFMKYMFQSPSSGSSSSFTNNSQSSTTQASACTSCKGTGVCPNCSKAVKKRYMDDRCSLNERNEVKFGYILCRNCSGLGFTTTNHNCDCPNGVGWCYEKDCTSGGCMDGWVFCEECNNNGNGSNLGKCNACKGTGKKQ